MQEVFDHLDHVPCWRRALAGEPPDWRGFLGGYTAAVVRVVARPRTWASSWKRSA